MTGANNVYPSYGDLSGAWCSKDGEHNGYLDVSSGHKVIKHFSYTAQLRL